MLQHWIHKNGHSRVLLFFNGWGMDERMAGVLPAPKEADMLCLSSYHQGTADLAKTLAQYTTIDVVAWSMGVWAAPGALSAITHKLRHCVALNGTCQPIDDELGIPSDIFAGTLRLFSPAVRDRFLRRMAGGNKGYTQMKPLLPTRSWEDQHNELAWWQQHAHLPVPQLPWTQAWCGTRDTVFPISAQLRFWQDTPTVVLPVYHFPFGAFDHWDNLLQP